MYKLSIDEQIEDLKEKGVKFALTTEKDAKSFLRYNNYYFRLKSYASNYDIYRSGENAGKYINLDFAFIQELSSLDMYLRKIIVHMCLDIEHFLKTRFIYDVTSNPDEDGFKIVKDYVSNNFETLAQLYANDSGATGDLIRKIHESEGSVPVWKFVEVLSFGRFTELYTRYYQTYGTSKKKNYIPYLGAIKYLRNAAAHNTCLLNSIRKPYSRKIKKTKKIMERISTINTLTTSDKSNKMENPVIHDFVVLLFVYNDILNYPANRDFRKRGMDELIDFLDNIVLRNNNKEWFKNNTSLKETYYFIKKIVDYLINQRNKDLKLKW